MLTLFACRAMRYKAAHCIVVYAATAAERHAPYGRGPAALGTFGLFYFYSRIAAMPGRSLPSRYSNIAPPPVEM